METAENSAISYESLEISSQLPRAKSIVAGIYIIMVLSALLSFMIGCGIAFAIFSIFFMLGWIPTGILAMVGIGVLYSVYIIVAGLLRSFQPKKQLIPALTLDMNKQPRFAGFLDELCSRMKTQRPDVVLLNSGPSFFVTQASARTFSGESEGRILSIGTPLLAYLNINELRAVLAHELAHFTGQDTEYSLRVVPAYRRVADILNGFHDEIYGRWGRSNSFWMKLPLLLPYKALKKYYLRLLQSSMKTQRKREKRADLIAAKVCGTESYANALRKAHGVPPVFEEESVLQIHDAYQHGYLVNNFYEIFREMPEEVLKQSDENIAKAMEKSTGTYYTHASLKDRLAYLPEQPEGYEDAASSESLFDALSPLQERLTEQYTKYLAAINWRTEYISSIDT